MGNVDSFPVNEPQAVLYIQRVERRFPGAIDKAVTVKPAVATAAAVAAGAEGLPDIEIVAPPEKIFLEHKGQIVGMYDSPTGEIEQSTIPIAPPMDLPTATISTPAELKAVKEAPRVPTRVVRQHMAKATPESCGLTMFWDPQTKTCVQKDFLSEIRLGRKPLRPTAVAARTSSVPAAPSATVPGAVPRPPATTAAGAVPLPPPLPPQPKSKVVLSNPGGVPLDEVLLRHAALRRARVKADEELAAGEWDPDE